jgi:hypothetical protein
MNTHTHTMNAHTHTERLRHQGRRHAPMYVTGAELAMAAWNTSGRTTLWYAASMPP